MGLAAQTPDHYKMRYLISDIDTDIVSINTITFTFHHTVVCCCGIGVEIFSLIGVCVCIHRPFICVTPFKFLTHSCNAVLFCCVCIILCKQQSRSQIISGFFPQLADAFPLAHCVGPQVPKFGFMLCAFQLAPGCLISYIAVIVVHIFNLFTTILCINCLHELFDTDKLINIDIMNFY